MGREKIDSHCRAAGEIAGRELGALLKGRLQAGDAAELVAALQAATVRTVQAAILGHHRVDTGVLDMVMTGLYEGLGEGLS